MFVDNNGWWLRLSLATLGGLFALAFAPYNFFPVAFLVFPVLVGVLDRVSDWRRAGLLGWWFGLGQFLGGIYWVGYSFSQQTQVPAVLAPVAVLLLSATLAIYSGLALALARYFWRKGAVRVLIFATAWTVMEWLRGHLFTGFPWNLTAHIWGGWDTMMQPVFYIGLYGVGFLSVILFASAIFLSSPAFFSRRANMDRRIVSALAAMIGMGFWLVGSLRLSNSEVTYYPDVRLRLVQANIQQLEKWKPENRGPNLLKYIDLSTQPTEAGLAPTHIIWPEAALTYYLDDTDLQRVLMQRLGSEAQLITGAPRVEADEQAGDEPLYYTSMYQLSAAGEILATYDKAHLVPFGEYLPLRNLLSRAGLEKLTYGSSDYSAGPRQRVLAVPGLPAYAPLICYEVIFPADYEGDARPNWLLNLTNDAWFGVSTGPKQHLQAAQFRALEDGVGLVRVAATGISAVIDPWGRVLAKLDLGVEGVLDVSLPMPARRGDN